jgi:hypothetical protein
VLLQQLGSTPPHQLSAHSSGQKLSILLGHSVNSRDRGFLNALGMVPLFL